MQSVAEAQRKERKEQAEKIQQAFRKHAESKAWETREALRSMESIGVFDGRASKLGGVQWLLQTFHMRLMMFNDYLMVFI